MSVRRDELAAVVGPDNRVYAIGGYGGSANASCLNSVERYDPTTNKWETIASMTQGRRALAAVAMPDGIYAIGGYNGKDYIRSMEKYCIETNTWEHVANLASSKCTMSAVVSPDYKNIYVIGGFNGAQLNEIEVYCTQTKKFSTFSPGMSQKRFMHSSVIIIH